MPEPHLEVTAHRSIAADPSRVYAVITDVTGMGSRSPETVSVTWVGEPGVRVGATFRGRNRARWLSWTTVAMVQEAEPGRRFSFITSPPSRSTSTYTIEPTDGGWVVTESMSKQDPQPLPMRVATTGRNHDRKTHLRQGIETTLERLAQQVEQP